MYTVSCLMSFACREEGMFALQEAIRLAQQHNNSLLLEHALVKWLYVCVCGIHVYV